MIRGTAASSVGAEGVHPSADWSIWERDRRVPRSLDGNGFGTNHADDFALLAESGIGAHRLTIEWARIEPREGLLDSDAIDRYLDILTSAKRAGVTVWLTLHHTTLPGWFADDEGGFADERAREYFWARHVDRCGDLFGNHATAWVPIEDPVGWAIRGFSLGTRPPGVCDPIRAAAALEGALLANMTAWRQLSSGDQPIMAVHGTPTLHRTARAEESALLTWDQLFWDSWITLLDEGVIALPQRRNLRVEDAVDAFDLVGIAFDGPLAVDEHGGLVPYPTDARRTDNGLAPNPEELGHAIRRVHSRLPNRPLAVASTGFGTDDDDWRDDLIDESLRHVAGAIDDGITIDAFFYDTAIDGYEWTRGFDSHRGLFDRDRRPRPSLRRLTGT